MINNSINFMQYIIKIFVSFNCLSCPSKLRQMPVTEGEVFTGLF